MFIDFMTKYEPIWLFLLLIAGLVIEFHSNYMLRKEYEYDEQKDIEKKQKRTRTTKKTTVQPGGGSVVEESTETTEPLSQGEQK